MLRSSEQVGGGLGSLYERYALRGLRYANSLLGNRSDAEEVVQEAFCRLVASSGAAALNASVFCPLFFTTVRNLAIDVLRKRRTRKSVSLDGVASLPARVAVESDGAVELRARIDALLGKLAPNEVDALKLKIDAKLSYNEIAEVLSCTKAQVRTWIYRGRRRLEVELRRETAIRGETCHGQL